MRQFCIPTLSTKYHWLLVLSAVFETVYTCKDGLQFNPLPSWPGKNVYIANSLDYVKMECYVDQTSSPRFNVTWTKDGDLLKDNNAVFQNENQELIIGPELDESESGTYECTATSAQGSCRYSGFVNIMAASEPIYQGPSILDPKTRVIEVTLGSTAYFSCTINPGTILPKLNSKWLRNGTLLEDSDKFTWNITVVNGRQKLSLTVHNVTMADMGNYTCFGENDFGNDTGTVQLKQRVSQKGHPSTLPWWQIGLIAVGGLVFVAMVTVPTVYFKVKQKQEKLEFIKPDPEDFNVPDYQLQYDVFVSYSSGDELWVKDELFPYLCKQGYIVNIDFKDFVPGMAIAENIIDATYKSRKTIVVMSKNFLKSMWGQFELQQAHNRAIVQRQDVLILIKYDKCKVPTKLMGKTFLDWTNRDVQPHFWLRLTEAIGEPQNFTEPNQFMNEKKVETKDKNEDKNKHDTPDSTNDTNLKLKTGYEEREITVKDVPDDEVTIRIKEGKKIEEIYDADDMTGLRISQEERMQLLA